jgi:hypothetical protein
MTWTKEYTAAVDFTTAPAGGREPELPCWIDVVGSGVVAVTNADGSTGTFNCLGGEKITGSFRAITTCTVTRVRVGTSELGARGGNAGPKGDTGAAGATGGANVPTAPSQAGVYHLTISAQGAASWTSDS